MTSFAPIPDPEDIPRGMVHVGWQCTNPGHDCLVPLSRAVEFPTGGRGEVHLQDMNHHALWRPVFAWQDGHTPSAESSRDETVMCPVCQRVVGIERWSEQQIMPGFRTCAMTLLCGHSLTSKQAEVEIDRLFG